MRTAKILFLFVFLGLYGIVIPSHTYAGSEYKLYSELEMKSLPPQIEAKLRMHLGDKSAAVAKIVDKYVKYYGWGYFTLHHYAKGLIYINRIYTSQFKYNSREFYIKIALGELSFSLKPRKIETFSKRFKHDYLPEIYCRRGEVHMLNNDYANAMLDFRQAIRYNRSFSKSYIMLSQCYQQIGDIANAKKMIQLARKYKQQSKKK